MATLALSRYPERKELVDYANASPAAVSNEVHRVKVTCSPACVLAADQRIVPGDAATEALVFLDPGMHSVAAGWGAKQTSSEVTAKAGGESTLTFHEPASEPAPTAAAAAIPSAVVPDAPAKDAQPGLPRAVFWSAVGVTAVLTGVSIWSGVDTRNNPGTEIVKLRCAGRGEACSYYPRRPRSAASNQYSHRVDPPEPA